MVTPERLDLKPILPFLPPEPGLRAHLFRVSALAARAARFNGYSEERVQDVGWAALLHHHATEPVETALPVNLLKDLGLEAVPGFAPLPAGAAAVLRSFRRSDPAADQSVAEAATLLESANLFDEQMENLPYEASPTEPAFAELLETGIIAAPFRDAVASFRVIARQNLASVLTRFPPGLLWEEGATSGKCEEAVRRYFEMANGEKLWTHSLEVAREVSHIASLTSSEALCAGLMHDIGRLAYQHSTSAEELKHWEELGFPAAYAEFLVSGTDHAEVGADIMAQRGFPASMVDAVKFHHRPELTESKLAAAICAFEDLDEALPSCARDNLAAKRIDLTEVRRSRAHGGRAHSAGVSYTFRELHARFLAERVPESFYNLSVSVSMSFRAAEITKMLGDMRAGDHAASDRLVDAVYSDLHGIARALFANERPDHTLQPTALVHEAWIRIFAGAEVSFNDRAQFYAVAARQMRRLLIDHGREFRAQKRGAGLKVSLDENLHGSPVQDCDFDHLNELLDRLERSDPEAARVVEMKFFSGMTDDEVAGEMGCSRSTVRRHWSFAKAWLITQMPGISKEQKV